MSVTQIELDDEGQAEAMRKPGAKSKKGAADTTFRDIVAGHKALAAFDRLVARGARGEFDQAAEAYAAAKATCKAARGSELRRNADARDA